MSSQQPDDISVYETKGFFLKNTPSIGPFGIKDKTKNCVINP
jgi:hypothetical protein